MEKKQNSVLGSVNQGTYFYDVFLKELVHHFICGSEKRYKHFPGFEVTPDIIPLVVKDDVQCCILVAVTDTKMQVRLYASKNPLEYFKNEEKRKVFSKSSVRQNDPYLLRADILFDPEKETFVDSQRLLHSPNALDLHQVTAKLETILVSVYTKKMPELN